MLDDRLSFSLVPWKPGVDRHFGKPVAAVVRGGHATWEFGRPRGLGV
jgi:Protein of unknown function (DUF3363)